MNMATYLCMFICILTVPRCVLSSWENPTYPARFSSNVLSTVKLSWQPRTKLGAPLIPGYLGFYDYWCMNCFSLLPSEVPASP